MMRKNLRRSGDFFLRTSLTSFKPPIFVVFYSSSCSSFNNPCSSSSSGACRMHAPRENCCGACASSIIPPQTKLSVLKDQLSNARIASNHVDKLQFVIVQESQDRRADINDYFSQVQARLERQREKVLEEMGQLVEQKMRVLKALSGRLPEVISSVGAAMSVSAFKEVIVIGRVCYWAAMGCLLLGGYGGGVFFIGRLWGGT